MTTVDHAWLIDGTIMMYCNYQLWCVWTAWGGCNKVCSPNHQISRVPAAKDQSRRSSLWQCLNTIRLTYILIHIMPQVPTMVERARFWRLVSVMCPFSVQRDQLHLHTYIYMYLKKEKTTSMHFFPPKTHDNDMTRPCCHRLAVAVLAWSWLQQCHVREAGASCFQVPWHWYVHPSAWRLQLLQAEEPEMGCWLSSFGMALLGRHHQP